MRILEKNYYEKRQEDNSLFSYFLNRKEPDRTELNRACEEVEAAMKIEHEKDLDFVCEGGEK